MACRNEVWHGCVLMSLSTTGSQQDAKALRCSGSKGVLVAAGLCWAAPDEDSSLSKCFTGVGGFGMAVKGSLPLPVL